MKWQNVGKDKRVADSHHGFRDGCWYEFVREKTNSGTYWTAWFCVPGMGRTRRLAHVVNFVQALSACIAHETFMSELDDQIAELDRKWKHACDVATASIGQPDRAENVAYRDELAARLKRLKK